jgi:hypothetical protein
MVASMKSWSLQPQCQLSFPPGDLLITLDQFLPQLSVLAV